METLFLYVAVFFLVGAVLFFWGALIVHPDLLDDAIVSIGLSLAAIGLSQIMRYGLLQTNGLAMIFLSVR